jgi:hypothetical protein
MCLYDKFFNLWLGHLDKFEINPKHILKHYKLLLLTIMSFLFDLRNLKLIIQDNDYLCCGFVEGKIIHTHEKKPILFYRKYWCTYMWFLMMYGFLERFRKHQCNCITYPIRFEKGSKWVQMVNAFIIVIWLHRCVVDVVISCWHFPFQIHA